VAPDVLDVLGGHPREVVAHPGGRESGGGMTAAIITPPPYRSAEWRAWRRGGLGASDLPAIVGVDTFKGEYALWCEKRATEDAEDAPSDVMRFGAFVEAYALGRWQESTGLPLVPGETFVNPRWPNLWATLDGREPERGIGVEAKYSTSSADLPERFVIQALGQIGIAELAAVDIVRIDPRGAPVVHRIERDDERTTRLLDLAQAWYERYVIGGEEPPLDGSPEARRALDRMAGTEQRDADERQVEMLAELGRTRKALERLTTAEERLVRDIKASMAGAGVLMAPGLARVTWAPVKGRTTTDWKAVAAEVAVPPEVIEKHTTTSDPTTRFAVRFEEGTE
jgi:predicted phage-related endonuclease